MSHHEPFPRMTGMVPPLTLLLPHNETKGTQITDIHHGGKLALTKAPDDHPGPNSGPPQLPTNAAHMLGL